MILMIVTNIIYNNVLDYIVINIMVNAFPSLRALFYRLSPFVSWVGHLSLRPTLPSHSVPFGHFVRRMEGMSEGRRTERRPDRGDTK